MSIVDGIKSVCSFNSYGYSNVLSMDLFFKKNIIHCILALKKIGHLVTAHRLYCLRPRVRPEPFCFSIKVQQHCQSFCVPRLFVLICNNDYISPLEYLIISQLFQRSPFKPTRSYVKRLGRSKSNQNQSSQLKLFLANQKTKLTSL